MGPLDLGFELWLVLEKEERNGEKSMSLEGNGIPGLLMLFNGFLLEVVVSREVLVSTAPLVAFLLVFGEDKVAGCRDGRDGMDSSLFSGSLWGNSLWNGAE